MTDEIVVLHIDDEQAYADLQQMYLEEIVDEHITIIRKRDPANVAVILEERSVDCVICDYDMPDVDGLDVLEDVRQDYPTLPFILQTGKGNEGVASEAIRLGVTDYVQKPSGSEQYRMLANRIRNAVGQFRRQQADRKAIGHVKRVVDRITDPILAVDESLRVIYSNEAGKRLFDTLGMTLDETPVSELLGDAESSFVDALERAIGERSAVVVTDYVPSVDARYEARIFPDEDGLSIYLRHRDEESYG